MINITIPAEKTFIHTNDYLDYNETLYNVTFEENSKLVTIDNESFGSFPKLTYFSLENCNLIEEIPSFCFCDCISLTTVILPKDGKLSKFGLKVFTSSGLKTLKLPPSVKCIPSNGWNGAFFNAAYFEKLDFYSTNGIEEVGSYVFYGSNLIEFDIGPNLKFIKASAFESVKSSFIKFTSSGANNNFCIEGNILYNKDKTSLICCLHGFVPESICSTTKVIESEAFHYSCARHVNFLNDGITKIEGYCFTSASIITIAIPKSVEEIGNNAFSYCANLKSIDIPPITAIKEKTFEYCVKLKTVIINNGTLRIKNESFLNCISIRYINTPQSLWKGFSEKSFDKCIEEISSKRKPKRYPNCMIHLYG